jgi:hypothetical protein
MRMRWIVNLAKPPILAILIAAPIGNTTVLLMFSLSLELLLTLLLLRERRWRLDTAVIAGEAPVVLLQRTVPHLRARRAAATSLPVASVRWRTASGGATSQASGKRAAAEPVERHVPVAGL